MCRESAGALCLTKGHFGTLTLNVPKGWPIQPCLDQPDGIAGQDALAHD